MHRIDQRGLALLIALVALTVLGALVTGGFALAQVESRYGLVALARVRSLAAAETAIADALEGWDSGDTQGTLGERHLLVLTLPGQVEASATLRALGGAVYAIRGIGIRRDGAGNAIAFAAQEALVLLDSVPENRVRPRLYPRGWRILP